MVKRNHMKKRIFFRLSLGLLFLISSFSLLSEELREPLTLEQLEILQDLTPGETSSIETEEMFEDFVTFSEDDARIRECEEELKADRRECIFGYTVFSSTPSTYALSSDSPVPPSYTLGPGDQLKIEYYGNKNLSKEGYITRTGSLHLPLLGPV